MIEIIQIPQISQITLIPQIKSIILIQNKKISAAVFNNKFYLKFRFLLFQSIKSKKRSVFDLSFWFIVLFSLKSLKKVSRVCQYLLMNMDSQSGGVMIFRISFMVHDTKLFNVALWIFFRKMRSVTVPRFGFFPQDSRIRVI